MSPFMDRRPRSRRYLVWKTRIFFAAAVVAFVGMYLNNPWVTGTALVMLLVGMVLRFLPERKAPTESKASDEPDGPDRP